MTPTPVPAAPPDEDPVALALASCGVKTETIWCTPTEAQRLLRYNTFPGQRAYKTHYAQFLANEIAQGRLLPLERITLAVVDDRPVLLDGQHRLSAIALSGTAQLLEVAYFNVADAEELGRFYAREDAGLPRNETDRTRALGVAALLGVSEGKARRVMSAMKFVTSGFASRPKNRCSSEDLAAAAVEYMDGLRVFSAAVAGSSPAMTAALNRAPVSAVALATCQDGPSRVGLERVIEFWFGVAKVDAGKPGDPRLTLQRYLLFAAPPTGDGYRLVRYESPEGIAWRVARCWGAWVRGENILRIQPPANFFPIRIEATRFDGGQDKARSNGKGGGKGKGQA
ncbi:MAG: hypothetical protein M1337_08935 [Actinobacteria bacterium]|nr:hypothetical protein [Actinomycetota bacterium]